MPDAAALRPVWGVAALLLAASDSLAARFGACVVRGELSNFTRAASGHCYFTLKDADGAPALVRCAMFRRAASLLDFTPRDGAQVELRGRVSVYESRGELQLVVEAMQRVGAGNLYEEFLRLKARLEAQGLFDAGRKQAWPERVARLGVITSRVGAALHDVLTTLARRAPHVAVVVYPSLVQGTEAPAALVQALQVAQHRSEVDALLLVRGGGSLEDLWAFNDERVVRAVADCGLPVMSGVGHETDITLTDLAADVRAPTPTAAAELAATSLAEETTLLQSMVSRMRSSVERHQQQHAQRLDRLALRLAKPAQVLAAQNHRLQTLAGRLQRAVAGQQRGHALALEAMARRFTAAGEGARERQQRRVQDLALRLQALDPSLVLRRGYAWVTDDTGRPVVSAHGLQAGQVVTAVWADGQAQATLGDVQLKPSSPA